MREKLLDLMKSEGLKSSQLADMLGVNPAGISHILAGRNKPGFDLLQKILRRFPRISPDWLLLDTGPMYRDAEETGIAADNKNTEPAMPMRSAADPTQGFGGLFAQNGPDGTAPVPVSAAPEDRRTPQPETIAKTGDRNAAVKRIVILREDGTFESYIPPTR